MLRAALLLVVLANALFLAWTRGWLSPSVPPPNLGQREPQRLGAQIRPESVVVLPGKAASDAISAARAAGQACLEAGPLRDVDVPAAEAALAAAQLPEKRWLREAAPLPPLWLVLAGRATDEAAVRARSDELRKLGLNFELLTAPAELATGFVLSRHASRAEAEAAVASTAVPGLKGVRVVNLPTPPLQLWLRVPRADADQQDRLKALAPEALAGGFKPCAAPVAGPAAAAASAASAAPAASAAAPGASAPR